jgi:hypothetical protein
MRVKNYSGADRSGRKVQQAGKKPLKKTEITTAAQLALGAIKKPFLNQKLTILLLVFQVRINVPESAYFATSSIFQIPFQKL